MLGCSTLLRQPSEPGKLKSQNARCKPQGRHPQCNTVTKQLVKNQEYLVFDDDFLTSSTFRAGGAEGRDTVNVLEGEHLLWEHWEHFGLVSAVQSSEQLQNARMSLA